MPTSPAGTFDVTSAFDVAVPAVAAPVIAALTAAADGPDDPSRYLLDRMIATLPDGTLKTVAAGAAPYVAAYLNARLTAIAPRFVAGLDALATGLDGIASHLATTERWAIDDGGAVTRTITGVRFELAGHVTSVRFADAGLGVLTASSRAMFTAGAELAIADHAHALPYGAWLRLGLDLAVIPSVEPGAHDLASALGALLDCDQLGSLVADHVGLGSAALYATACETALTVLAAQIDDQLAALDATPRTLQVTGTAAGFDRDGDGTMDEIHAGNWTGALHDGGDNEPIRAGSFTGSKAP